MWRSFQHPNILPLVGVMMSQTRFAMVSHWMANGNINEFIKQNPEADRFELEDMRCAGSATIVSRPKSARQA